MSNIPIRKLVANPDRITRKIMIYGGGKDEGLGVGKTTLIGTAQDCPEMRDVLLIDLDGGSTSVLSRGDISGVDLRRVDDVEKLLWQIANKDPAAASIRTIVLDGTSELQNNDLAEIADKAATDPHARRQRDRDRNEQLDYLKNKNRMLRVLRMARDVSTNHGVNLIVTCWARKTWPMQPGTEIPDKTQPPVSIEPDISGAVAKTLLGFLDDVWYLSTDDKGTSRYLVTDKYQQVKAKTRDVAVARKFVSEIQGKTIPVITNPTFVDLYARYRAAYTG